MSVTVKISGPPSKSLKLGFQESTVNEMKKSEYIEIQNHFNQNEKIHELCYNLHDINMQKQDVQTQAIAKGITVES